MNETAAGAAEPSGSWASPIDAPSVAAASIRFGQTAIRDGAVFWSESRPAESGRSVLVRATGGDDIADLTPPPFNVRTRAHEYGGGAFALLDDGVIAFCDDADQQIHLFSPGRPLRRLTDLPKQRFADLCHDRRRGRLLAVREDHREGDIDAIATIVAIDLTSGAQRVLVEGHDFFSNPALSPDGTHLAWLSWDHPDMPWDATTLWLSDVDADGGLGEPQRVAGGGSESVFQPSWSPSGELHFVADRSGWWNLYRLRDAAVEPLWPMAAEFGEPQWVFGMSTYGFDGRGRIVCTYLKDAWSTLAILDTEAGTLTPIETPFCVVTDLHVEGGSAVFVASGPTSADAVIRLELSNGRWRTLRSAGEALDPAFVSIAEPIDFPVEAGVAHAFFYRPTHPKARVPENERPPLLVCSHGGPTGLTDAGLRRAYQFWTSRGIAIVDVNYGGSSGYGRAYRERLKGRWGIVDVDDCVAAARFLVERGDVDPQRLAIRGHSAGGFTTLAALTFRHCFQAGASHYGISDLETLARDTHKFESRYLDSLVGPYPARADRYRARSPIHFTERLSSALILLQGAEDKVVPPSQAESMFEAVRAKGLPVALLVFEGEQHGFRQARHIVRALEAELHFYGRVFGFVPADPIEPVPIENLPTPTASPAAAFRLDTTRIGEQR